MKVDFHWRISHAYPIMLLSSIALGTEGGLLWPSRSVPRSIERGRGPRNGDVMR